MPLVFSGSRLYIRRPDAIAYIRGQDARGTVAFYERWHGLYAVAHLTGGGKGMTLCTADGRLLCHPEGSPTEFSPTALRGCKELLLLDSDGTVLAEGRLKRRGE